MKIPKDPSNWKNWTSAQDFCVEEGGTLVAIENEVEQGRVLDVQSAKITIFLQILSKCSPTTLVFPNLHFKYYIADDA